MNEIWKEYKLDFKSTGLLVSNYGNVKNLKNKMNQAIHYYNQKML